MYRSQITETKSSPIPRLPMLPTATSSTLSTPDLQLCNMHLAPYLLDSNSADALEQLLQSVGLSSENLFATPQLMPQEPNANLTLPSRPQPDPLDFCQPSEPKRNRRGRLNALRLENGRFKSQCSPTKKKTMTKVPTAFTTTTSENSKSLKITFRVSPYENLPLSCTQTHLSLMLHLSLVPSHTMSMDPRWYTRQVIMPVHILLAILQFLHFPPFSFCYLSKLRVTLSLLSFKRCNTQHALVYNCLFLKTCCTNISNLRLFFTSIQCWTPIQIVTI